MSKLKDDRYEVTNLPTQYEKVIKSSSGDEILDLQGALVLIINKLSDIEGKLG